MPKPPVYDRFEPEQFGGVLPTAPRYETARAVVLPVPFERTVTYGAGTANGPRAIIHASSQVELWDEEMSADVTAAGIVTLPAMDLEALALDDALDAIGRAAGAVMDAGKFLVTLGGEHSITPPLVAAAAARHKGLTVLQIDAHADLRDSYHDDVNSHACAMRRSAGHAPLVQVGIRNLSQEEAIALPGLPTTIFYDWNMRAEAGWMDRVVAAIPGPVYLTIDLDGLDPALMPAVGTPEPGGLSWHEVTSLLRKVFAARDVVACDVVELAPIPGMASPDFVAARLVYKLLTYKLAGAAS